ncbi:MAG: Uma2 family endonuclease [Betaproteobacteria bacterium]|nr:Uma2 family endonuclease [Betaproteobacteria bacterium]
MGLPASVHLNVDEYLGWEAQQRDKHEYVSGEVYAMVGVTRCNVAVAINVVNILSGHLRDSLCRVYAFDMKLRIEAANAFYYPDVFVTCNANDHQAGDFMSSTVLVVEVLSPSTAGDDRGEKFAAYRKLPGPREYVLIDPDRKRIECFRRSEDDLWVLHEPGPDQSLTLHSVDLRIAGEDVFRRVD